MPIFNSYRESIIIKDHVKAKHIIAGDYSYYSGYYHDKAFEDCVMYLDEADNHQDTDEIDRLNYWQILFNCNRRKVYDVWNTRS